MISQPIPPSKVRVHEQYDRAPYPNFPLDTSPDQSLNTLFLHNLVTPYYLQHRQVTTSQGKLILDAGCGSGYTSLVLAAANPGATILGIDLSEKSIEVSRQRLQHHGYDNAEFYVMPLEELPQLGVSFDYINCDEVLYLLDNPRAGLETLKTVLKPQGILRTNLHSAYQRANYYRAQTLFKTIGLLDQNPQESEITCVIETMQALRKDVLIKDQTWEKRYTQDPQGILMNYLIQSDKGFTIPELFAMLRDVDLAFINMVKWRKWEITDLFEGGPAQLPEFWRDKLAQSSVEERLHLYELINPTHRLLDFWCTSNRIAPLPRRPLSQWQPDDWNRARIHLHPQLKSDRIKQELINCVNNQLPFILSQYISVPRMTPCVLQVDAAASLLPLWDKSLTLKELVQRRLQVRPTNLISLEPSSPKIAFAEVKQLITWLEQSLYLLVEIV